MLIRLTFLKCVFILFVECEKGFVSVKQRKYLCVGFERFFYNDYVRARKVLLRLIYAAAVPFVFLKLA